MEALFVILKVIGILLAILLLLGIALILVPVRYRVDIKVQDEAEGKARIHWLLHLVDVRIFYKEKKLSYKLRVFGIPLPFGKKKESGQKSPGRIKKGKKEKNIPEKPGQFKAAGQEALSSRDRETAGEENSPEKEVSLEKGGSPEKEVSLEKGGSPEKEVSLEKGGSPEKEVSLEKGGSPEKEVSLEKGGSPEKEVSLEKGGFPEKGSSVEKEEFQDNGLVSGGKDAASRRKKKPGKIGFLDKIKTRFHNLKHRFLTMAQDFRQRTEDIKNGTTTLKEQAENIKGMISEETNQEAFFHILRETKYLLRHYVPGTISGNVTFSMGNPELTGKALGAMSLLPFWARSRMVVMPDFLSESFYAKGILFVKGHIRLLHIPVLGIRLVMDKNIRKLITNIRK